MKERLTGAIILVALIVLLVPELLTGPIRPKSAPAAPSTAAAPPVAQATRGEPPLRSYTLTLGAAPPALDATATPAAAAAPPRESSAQTSSVTSQADRLKAASAGSDERSGPQPATAPDDSASRAEKPRLPQQSSRTQPGLQAAKSPSPPVVREARSPASSTGWVVQLGSFASRRNADRLAHSLAGKGLRMSVSPARAGSRVLWRVRAGPAPDRAGAQRLAARLRALGHRGELLPVR